MMIKMKKKIIAVICVIALTLSLPMLAWAAPSPSNDQATSNGVVLNASAGGGTVAVAASSVQASNTVVSANDEVLASFEGTGDATDVSLTFNVGVNRAGYTMRIFIENNDGTIDAQTVTIAADGTAAIHVDEFPGGSSLFTLVLDTKSGPASGGSGTDTSPTSPKTGVDISAATTAVAGMTIGMAVAAVFVALALRKKITQ
jgi:hypothetical protein